MSKTEPKTTVEWNELNWRKIQKATFKLQKRIYRAYISGNVQKGRRLQKTLINSYYNRLLAVRLQHLTYKRLRRWADRRHPNKSKHWVSDKYWKTVEDDNWVFKATGEHEKELIKHSSVPITRYTKVTGEESPFNGDTLYWGKRMNNHPEIKKSIANLLKQQKGKCNWCKLPFQEEEKLEEDHIIPVKAGGSNKRENFQLLHRHCHDEKTRDDLKIIKAYKQS